jgi:hypothetical protein
LSWIRGESAKRLPSGVRPRTSLGPAAGKGRAITVAKHGSPLKIRQMLPLLVMPAVVLAAASPWFWPFAIPAAIGYGAILGEGDSGLEALGLAAAPRTSKARETPSVNDAARDLLEPELPTNKPPTAGEPA